MGDSQMIVKPYLAIIDKISMEVGALKQLLNNSAMSTTSRDAKFQISGQLAALAEDLNNLAKEIESKA
jgi:hypothetical protein